MPRKPTTKTPAFTLYVPRKAQWAILALPEFQRRLVAERRAMICHFTPALKRGGLSQNQIADLFNLNRSALSLWLNRYATGGIEALVPQSARKLPRKGMASPSTLTFLLR